MYNKHLIESHIECNIIDLKMEVRLSELKVRDLLSQRYKKQIRVDLIGTLSTGASIFVEVSIRDKILKDIEIFKSEIYNLVHYISKTKFAIIVAIALHFDDEFIYEFKNYIKSYNIVMHFLILPEEVISTLDRYAITEISLILQSELTKLSCLSLKKIESNNINRNNYFKVNLDGEDKGNYITKEILKQLRENIDWHVPIHHYKILTQNEISFGCGKSDEIMKIICKEIDNITIKKNKELLMNIKITNENRANEIDKVVAFIEAYLSELIRDK